MVSHATTKRIGANLMVLSPTAATCEAEASEMNSLAIFEMMGPMKSGETRLWTA